MRVRVRYVAMLREQRGRSEETVELREGDTARALFGRLFPGSAVPVGFAVGHRQVPGEHLLADGDEVVFLPPVGGG